MTLRGWSRLVLALALAASCQEEARPLPPKLKLTAAQQAEGRRRIAAAVARVAAQEARRDAAFAALDQVTRVEAPCPVTRAQLGIADDLTPSGRTTTILGMTRIVPPESKRPAPGATTSRITGKVAYLTEELGQEHGYGETAEAYLDALTRKLDAITPPPFELALVLDKLVSPRVVDDKTFTGGATRGTLYLWSEAAGAIVCAGAVGERSAAEVSYRDYGYGNKALGLSAHLDAQLVVSTIDAGLGRLRAVAPSLAPAAPPK